MYICYSPKSDSKHQVSRPRARARRLGSVNPGRGSCQRSAAKIRRWYMHVYICINMYVYICVYVRMHTYVCSCSVCTIPRLRLLYSWCDILPCAVKQILRHCVVSYRGYYCKVTDVSSATRLGIPSSCLLHPNQGPQLCSTQLFEQRP